MPNGHERHLTGLDALAAATTLLQRARAAHPTAGLFEAADLQWWWRMPRSTDALPQLFWFDPDGRPQAAVISTDWSDEVALTPITMPDATADVAAHVVERGLAHAAACGLHEVTLEVDPTDAAIMGVLERHGFTVTDDGLVETWIDAADRPAVSPLADGCRLSNRFDTATEPHHMVARSGPEVEARLRQTSLYRADLDLVVHHAGSGAVAAYGLFWHDPVTATGMVEPMRTDDSHQRRGLARHVLTAGMDLLARAGAQRIKICYRPGNPAARDLYLGVGFRPVRQTVMYSGRTAPAAC